MREVTIRIPEREPEERSPALHDREEHRSISLHDGPAIAFTTNETRIYDSNYDEFIPLSHRELVEILAAAYDIDDTPNNDE
jgi:hypothetical protein